MTAETAVALPALMLVLAAALWTLAAVGARIECIDAARAGARAAARGEAPAAVRSASRQAAPRRAQVAVERSGGTVRVTVRARVRPLAPLPGGLPAVTARGAATAAVEGPR